MKKIGLSEVQKGIYFDCQIFNSLDYNIASVFSISELDLKAFQTALELVVSEQEIVRTRLVIENDDVFMHIQDDVRPQIDFIEIDVSVTSKKMKANIKKVTHQVFSFEESLLFRVSVIKGIDGYLCAICAHHIIVDGISMGIFKKKLINYYQKILSKEEILFDTDQSYSYFVTEENYQLESGQYETQKKFWYEKTKEMVPVELRADFQQRDSQKQESKEQSFKISEELFENIQEKCKEMEITVFQFFFASFYLLLHKQTGQQKITLTTPFSHRPTFELQETIGCFIYTLPISLSINGKQLFEEVTKDLYEEMLQCYKHLGYPNNLIARDQKTSIGGPSIFDISFVSDFFEDIEDEHLGIQNVFTEDVTFPGKMMAILHNQGKTKEIKIQYKNDYFSKETISFFGKRFIYLLENLVEHKQQPISEISILSREEENQILALIQASNDSDNHYNNMKEALEKSLNCHAEAIALSGKNFSYTRKEINEKANFLANKILRETNGKKVTVAIQARRSPELVLAVFAVIKAGCSYLPIDIHYPETRKTFLLEDSNATLLFTDKAQECPVVEGLKVFELPSIDSIGQADDPDIVRNSNDLLYVEYTSGSTGKPKAVLVQDASVINALSDLERKFPMKESDVYCFKTAFSFDISGTELYGWIFGKGSLFILEEGAEKDAGIILNSIFEENITHINFVPSMFRLFLDNISLKNKNMLQTLKWIFVGGEALTHETIQQFLALETSAKLENMYGPTECTIWSTTQLISEPVNSSYISIGKPLNKTEVYILDERQNLQPIGIEGEICIAGIQVAQGYKNRETLNKKVFITNPYYKKGADPASQRMYRTGDTGRLKADGSIEYIQRIDHQIKIAGQRIELGEIENTMEKLDEVIQAVAVVKHQDSIQAKIGVYYLGNKIEQYKLQEQLRKQLPSYMIPSVFVHVTEFPYNNSGKVDRKCLEQNKLEQAVSTEEKCNPQNEMEKIIFKVWKEVLNTESFGIDDKFIDIGGHSLAFIQVHNKLKKELNREFPVTDLLEMPTIRLLAEKLTSHEANVIENRESFFKPPKNIQSTDIAIIGMSINVPGADNLLDFWKNLVAEEESIYFYTDDELREMGISENLIDNPNYVKGKGRINHLETFDSGFFDYSPSEVAKMSPQLRMLYRGAWEAFEDAGHIPQDDSLKTGVFVGGSDDFEWYKTLINSKENFGNIYERFTLSTNHFIATRLAYKFNITGPVYSALTGCSTTLVTTHLACQSLILGECDVALAGGITVELPNEGGYLYEKGMMFSHDGHCRPFDQKAQGTVFSNGMGLVVLKRADEAYRDGDNIYAIIKGSAINNDGNQKIGFTAPSVKGQVEVIQEAYKRAKIDPETISYVEAHGTGTALGDPIEVQSLTEAFASAKKQYCTLGSVKGNVGHTDTAAGVVGLIKTALVLKNRFIPATVNYQEANHKIDFSQTPFHVHSKGSAFQSKKVFKAGINSFGVGGTNAHMVLEESVSESKESEQTNNLVVISGKTEEVAKRNVKEVLNFINQSLPRINLSHAAWTLQKGRLAFSYRYAFVLNRQTFSLEKEMANVTQTPIEKCEKKQQVYFMFSGQGSQYQGMLRNLFENETAGPLGSLYRSSVLYLLSLLEESGSEDIKNSLFGTENPDVINQTQYTQLCLFITEYSLAKTLLAIGIKPDVLIGHSIGELVAATIAGVWSVQNAIKIIKMRGELMQRQPQSTMLAIMADYESIQHLLPETCYLALRNTTNKCVIGGESEAIEQLNQTLSELKISASSLKTSHAFHTPIMSEARDAFYSFMKDIELSEPTLPILSNLTGDYVKEGEMTNPEYWADHIVKTVCFEQSLAQIVEDPSGVFVEIGPGNTLSSFLKQHKNYQQQVVTNVVRHQREKKEDENFLLEKIGYLWKNGMEVDWQHLTLERNKKKISLPTYSFEETPYPIEQLKPKAILAEQTPKHDLGAITSLKNNSLEMVVNGFQEVFGFDELSTQDDFFELGGDSLKAANLISILEEMTGVNLEIADIFDHPKIGDLAKVLRQASTSLQDTAVILPAQESEHYPLSTAQKRMFTLQMLEENTTSFNLFSVTFIHGKLDQEKVKIAISKLIDRHEILKTSFNFKDNELVQQVVDDFVVPFEYQDNSSQRLTLQTIRENNALNHEINQFVRPFDLSKAPLLRVKLIQLNQEEQLLLFDVHHIVSDGTSMEIITQDFNAFYFGHTLEKELQYRDYAVWEKEKLQSEELLEQKNFWLKELAGSLPVLQLPLDYERPKSRTFAGGRVYFTIEPNLSKEIKTFSQKNGVTLYMTMLWAWFILLANYSNQTEIIVGSPVSGRTRKEVHNMVGMFINMLPIKLAVEDVSEPLKLLSQVKEKVLKAFQNQEYPFDQLVENLKIPRTMNRNAIFDVCFDFQNMQQNELEVEGVRFSSYEMPIETTSYDLVVTCQENSVGQLEGFIDYATDLFKESTVVEMIECYKDRLNQLITASVKENESSDINLLDSSLGILEMGSFSQQSISELFEHQALTLKDKDALILSSGKKISFETFNKKANSLANKLKEIGIIKGDLVGLIVGRDEYLMISMFAVLKLGAAYVPIDPAFPKERIEYMLENSEAKIVISKQEIIDNLMLKISYIDYEKQSSNSQDKLASNDNTIQVPEDSLAYIIYTSGTTGRPKGVMISQKSIINFIQDTKERNIFTREEDKVFSLTTNSFDIFGFESLVTLCLGHTVYIASEEEQLDARLASEKIVEHQLTHILSTVSRIKAMVENQHFQLALNQLTCILSGGENYPISLMHYLQKNSRAKIYNMYGPSETTIWSTVKELTTANEINIGTPIKNTQVYILDSHGNSVTEGTFGEICIGGKGVALGYKNNQEETQKRFVRINEDNKTQVYKTGDRGRILSNGEVELSGRLDEQVKIRGYRVELSEIEHHIQAHQSIDQAVVKVFENEVGINYLVAFYTVKQFGLEEMELKTWLSARTPEYMLPTKYIPLTKFPQLPNGKIDKNQLCSDVLEKSKENVTNKLAKTDRNMLEEEITRIWQEILANKEIRLQDNFFDIGGNSLGLMLVNNLLQKELQLDTSLLDLFEHPTIQSLLDFLCGEEAIEPALVIHDKEEKWALESDKEEIAVIGMAGCFPNSNNIQDYWQKLVADEEMTHFFSNVELENVGISKVTYEKDNYVAAKGILADTEYFDSEFFNYSKKEATMMDPQVRKLHEIVWKALEEAGYNPFKYKEKIGLFAGSSTNVSWLSQFLKKQYDSVSGFELLTLNDKDFLTTKVSYKLNLKGPSINIQTACSTSLVAIHQAKESLLRGECKIAVAGGVSITYPQKEGYLWYPGMIFSKDGHCRPFSANASGTISGNGGGVVVLKRLSEAKREGDTILAVIKGSAVNNDGIQKIGYTAPSIAGQKAVIQSALRDAQVEPEKVAYVETHGTGTELGDPIEFEALKQAYNTKKRNYCSLGAVKANIGHLDAAAGVAGFIKTVMVVKNRIIPPLTNFDQSNEKIDLLNSPFRTDRISRTIPNTDEVIAGISSFGIGGTNAHIILGSYEHVDESEKLEGKDGASPIEILPFSGKSLSNLSANQQSILKFIDKNPEVPIAQIAQQLQRRATFEYRGFQVIYESGSTRQMLPIEYYEAQSNPDRLSIILLDESLDIKQINNFFQEQKEKPFSKAYMNAIEEALLVSEKSNSKNLPWVEQWIVRYGICKSLQCLGIKGEFHAFTRKWHSLENVLNNGCSLQEALVSKIAQEDKYFSQVFDLKLPNRAWLVLGSQKNIQSNNQKEILKVDTKTNFDIAFYHLIGQLWAKGYSINLDALHNRNRQNIALPPYNFSPIYYPNDIISLTENTLKSNDTSSLLTKAQKENSSIDIREHLVASWQEVLGTNRIEPNDDFFALGGHSLTAIMLSSKIKETISVELSVSEIFDHANFSDMQGYLQDKLKTSIINNQLTKDYNSQVKKVDEQLYYNASYAQKRMYATQGLEEDQLAYNLGAAYYLHEKINLARLEETFQALVNRHESLRTSFSIVDGELKQFILPTLTIKLEQDFILEDEIEQKISNAIQPFKLSEAPLIRMKLFTVSDDKHLLVIDMHHIISDQYSIQVLLKEFHSLYNGEKLEPLSLQYKDFAAWQKEYINSENYAVDLAYWQQELSGEPPALVLPYDYSRDNTKKSVANNLLFRFSDHLNQSLVDYAKKENVTPYMVIFSAIQLLFWKYTAQEDFVLGTAISGRTNSELNSIVGMFVNTLAIRTKIDPSTSIKDHLEKTKKMLLQSLEHQNCQFDLLVEELAIKKEFDRNPLFDIMINYINMGTTELQLGDKELEPYEVELQDPKFDLTCTIIEKSNRFRLEVEYDGSLFKEASINTLGIRLQTLLENLLTEPDKPLQNVSITTMKDWQFIDKINQTTTKAPLNNSVISLIGQRAQETPDKVALIYQDEKMTYAELEKRANQLGRVLQSKGVQKGNRVAILLERGPMQIISILGIMKVGGVYVPMDTDFPSERIEFMLEDSQAVICLTKKRYCSLLSDFSSTVLLDDKQELNKEKNDAIPLPHTNGQDDLYIIYTSGSTGEPKGVLVQNQNVIRVVCKTNYVDISSKDIFLQLSNYAFDGSIFDIFGALLHGASLVLIDKEDVLEIDRLAEIIKKEHVTGFFMTASLFNMFVDWELEALKGVKMLLVGGEALSAEHVKKALTVLDNGRLINGYGPTETTVFACCHKISGADDLTAIPIGKPIANTTCYVLDPYQNVLPPGISGELCIGGAGVASGYVNRNEQTQGKFIHLTEKNERVYKTGDLVRLGTNGLIYYLGRNDEQVKIRGFRIELGEIEYRIKAISGIRNALVMAEKDAYGSTKLVSYYILASASNVEKEEIVASIQKTLPPYMIPSEFIRVSGFPITQNGKLDKRKLKKNHQNQKNSDQDQRKVVDDVTDVRIEQKKLILVIMKKVLDYPALTMDDDFFDHGGESIKAISLTQELKSCGYPVKINEIFKYSTVNKIAQLPYFANYQSFEKDEVQKFVNENKEYSKDAEKYLMEIFQLLNQQANEVLTQKIVREFQLSPSQRLHLGFADSETGFIHDYDGNETEDTLKETIWKMIERQQLLKSTLSGDKKVWQERDVLPLKESFLKNIPVIDLTDSSNQLLITQTIASHVLRNPYKKRTLLWRCVLVKTNEHHYRIIWGFHHVIFDGMSLEIIKNQFDQFLSNAIDSSELPLSYSDYVETLGKLPAKLNEQDIINRFSLKKWVHQTKRITKNKNKLLDPWQMKIPLDTLTDNVFNEALKVIKTKLEPLVEQTREETIPIGLVQYGREIGQDKYFDTVGEFLDILPVNLVKHDEANLALMKQIDWVKSHSVHFLSLAMQESEVGKIIEPVFGKRPLKMIVLNFQGYVHSADKEAYEKFSEIENDQNQIADQIITVHFDDNDLYVAST